MDDDGRVPLRRLAMLATAIGLSLTALVAIVGVVTGSFESTDWRLVATSFGFSLFSALGAAGARASRLGAAGLCLGLATAACAAASFVLLACGLWVGVGDGLWRVFAGLVVLSLGGSHASLMLAARSPGDSALITTVCASSIGAGAFDSLIGVGAIAGVIDLEGTLVRLLAVLIIVQLLTSVLPSLLRRAARRQRVSDRGGIAGSAEGAPL